MIFKPAKASEVAIFASPWVSGFTVANFTDEGITAKLSFTLDTFDAVLTETIAALKRKAFAKGANTIIGFDLEIDATSEPLTVQASGRGCVLQSNVGQ